MGDARYHLLQSETLERPLHIYVRLPTDYSESVDARFPTVYLLDGGIHFPMLGAYYHYLNQGEELPAVIIVGISYGADTAEQGNFRSTDFTAVTEEREYWGGAPVFQAMIADELLPLVESEYRSRKDRRMIFGQSLGGQFVLYSALTRPELFWGHIASNPALHRNLPFFLEWQGEGAMPEKSSLVFVSSGSMDNPRFRKPAMEWVDHWREQEKRPWSLETHTLEGHSHFSVVPEAFRQGLQWLFSMEQR